MTNFTLTILFFLSLFTAPSDELKDNVHLAESVEVMESNLVITEIMYNPNSVENRWEWIEVYNKGLESIDLSGYVLDDNNNSEQGAANILAGSIPPKSTAILFDADISLEHFTEVWGDVNAISVVGWPGLNNPGDSIGIWDSFESYDGDNTSQVNVIEQVIYENGGDWPESDNAGSIFLIALDFDNTLGSNWSLSIDAIETPLGTASSSQNLHENTGLDIGSPNPIIEEEDTTQPIIECPEMVEINNDEGQCSSEVPLLKPRATDNVSTAFIFNAERGDGLELEDPFPTGDTMITWTATDEANNTSLPCVQLISVIDRELPTAIAQNITIELDEDGMATIFPEELDNIETPSFDNCGIDTYLASRTEFNCADLEAPLQVEFSVVDANGNTSIETNVFVTVVDKIKPIMACNADIITISSNGNPIILEDVTEPLVSDNCDEAPILSFSRSDQQELNAPFDVGATTITWQAVDAVGNVSMCVQTILIDFIASMDNDIIAFSIPEQVGETVIDVEAKAIDVLMPLGTDVTDLRPSFVVSESASSSPEIGEAVDFTEAIFYSISAQDGSVQEWIVTVTLEEDITPPTFDVNGKTEDFVTELEVGDTYIVGEISNIVDESITSSEILGDDLVNTTIEGGPFLVSYSVSDGSNVSTITETITVVTQMQPAPSILSFTLVNADTNEDLFPLEEGMEISIAELPNINLNIRANASDDTRSVALSMSGDMTTSRTENVLPYALYGDSPAGNYKGSEFGLGSYTVAATAYSERQLAGDSGEELRLSFSIIDPCADFDFRFGDTGRPNTCGGTDGAIEIVTIGGTAPFTYQWSHDPEYTDFIHEGLIAGTYIIIVTDANGCSLTITKTLNDPPKDEITLNPFPDIFEHDSPITLMGGFPEEGVFSGEGVTDGFFDPNIGPGVYDITYTYINPVSKCENSAIQTIEVNGLVNLIAATYLQGAANPNPTGPILRTEEGNRETYLKFDLSTFSGPITGAQLKMQVASDPGFGTLEVYLGSDSNWTETELNGANKPTIVGEAIAVISGTHSLGETKIWDLDVRQISNDGLITLIVKHSNGNDVAFASDETDLAPELIITSGSSGLVDTDGDGFYNDVDCDDDNPDVHPDAVEICDGIDNNCDGLIDEADPAVTCGSTEVSADLIDATYLQGAANPNPTGPILRTEDGVRETYLKFDMGLLNGSVAEARLEMQVASDPGFGTLEVFLGSHSNWTETDLNGSNKPTVVGSAIGSITGKHSLGQTKTWTLDTSQFTSSGFVTLIVKHSNGNDVAFASDESSLPPQLILTVDGTNNSADELAGTNTLSVFPNPATVEISLTFKEPTELVMVYFYDVLGRMMGSYEGATIETNGAYILDVQSMPASTYYVKAFDVFGNTYQKQVLIKK